MLIKIIGGVILLALLVLNPALCVFVSIGLTPAFVSSLVDTRPGKNTSATIFFFNLTGLTLAGMKFINNGMQMNLHDALSIQNLFMVYLFAAMGYFIVWLIPKITVIIVDYKNERRALRIREKIAKLVDEWGMEVRN